MKHLLLVIVFILSIIPTSFANDNVEKTYYYTGEL